jgi:uncharacterized membrane protein YebE (DUF533 family)
MAFTKEVSTSKFYMLRCVVAMAHADGVVTDAEIAYISSILNRLSLTPEQRKTFNADFKKAQKVEELLPYINEPKFRGQAVDFARIMAFKDGVLHPSEEEMLKKLHAAAMDGIDMDALRKTVKENVAKEMNLHDIEVRKAGAFKDGHAIPYFQVFDEILLNNGIDLLKE